MRVYLGADHSVLEVKEQITAHLEADGHDVVYCGTYLGDNSMDYPAYCILAAMQTVNDLGSLGIVLGREGNQEQIAANKVMGVRCALAWSPDSARLARERYDAQVVGIGVEMHRIEEIFAIVDAFVDEEWAVREEDFRRIELLCLREENRTPQGGGMLEGAVFVGAEGYEM